MEQLHYANSKNLYLLQDAVMDFIVENEIEILEKKMLAGALDMVAFDCAAGASEKNVFSVMSISELRRRAHA